MKLLLTNDDGIDAPGLAALLAAARAVGDPVVAAPTGPQSGVSHAVTTGTAVRVEPRGPDRFAVFGTPADCVRVGLHRLAPDAAFVLSGINHGGNLGADVYYSGTVAAVREAVLHGWTGVAVSHYKRRGLDFDWARAAGWAARVLADLLARPAPAPAQLPARGSGDALRRRLPQPGAGRGRGRGRLLRRPNRGDADSAAVRVGRHSVTSAESAVTP
jgi:5'-nucleotidase